MGSGWFVCTSENQFFFVVDFALHFVCSFVYYWNILRISLLIVFNTINTKIYCVMTLWFHSIAQFRDDTHVYFPSHIQYSNKEKIHKFQKNDYNLFTFNLSTKKINLNIKHSVGVQMSNSIEMKYVFLFSSKLYRQIELKIEKRECFHWPFGMLSNNIKLINRFHCVNANRTANSIYS